MLAKELETAFGTRVEAVVADLSDAVGQREIEAVIREAPVDLLVNNAGLLTVGRFAELDADREEAAIRLNVLATVRLTRAALPAMLARGRGAIINVSSISGFVPGPFTATYNATKAYLNSFTEALHREVLGTGVRVQLLCPGFIRTEIMDRANADSSKIPSFAWMTADDVVDASLATLGRSVVCVPGFGYRMLATVLDSLPRVIVRQLPTWPRLP
jgi:short-subunit dehydrogenase